MMPSTEVDLNDRWKLEQTFLLLERLQVKLQAAVSDPDRASWPVMSLRSFTRSRTAWQPVSLFDGPPVSASRNDAIVTIPLEWLASTITGAEPTQENGETIYNEHTRTEIAALKAMADKVLNSPYTPEDKKDGECVIGNSVIFGIARKEGRYFASINASTAEHRLHKYAGLLGRSIVPNGQADKVQLG